MDDIQQDSVRRREDEVSLAEVLILKRQQRNDVVVSGDLLVDLRNIFDLQINDDPLWQRLIFPRDCGVVMGDQRQLEVIQPQTDIPVRFEGDLEADPVTIEGCCSCDVVGHQDGIETGD